MTPPSCEKPSAIFLQKADGNKQIMKRWKWTKLVLDQQGFSILTKFVSITFNEI